MVTTADDVEEPIGVIGSITGGVQNIYRGTTAALTSREAVPWHVFLAFVVLAVVVGLSPWWPLGIVPFMVLLIREASRKK